MATTIKLSDLMGQTEADIIKAVSEEVVAPWHDIADDAYTVGSPQTVLAGQEYTFEANASYTDSNFPDHITRFWENNIAVFDEILDSPVCVCRVQLTFDPATSVEGYVEFKAYINETIPVLFQTIRTSYKVLTSRMEALFAFYVGDTAGYDIKNKGLYFTYIPKTNGTVYDRGILIYKT